MKKNNYAISIIIPVYNSEKFLSECIESVINQTFDFNQIQVILINDGSSDNSLAICKSYSEKYENILVIDQKNSGVSVARNAGIKIAEGKFIAFLDSDDMISKNSVKDIIAFFEKNYDEIDIVTYPIILLKNKVLSKGNRYLEYNKGTNIYDVNEYIFLNQSNINIVLKNDKKNKLYYNEKMKLSEDQLFCTELIMRKEKIGFVSTAKYIYRKYGASSSDLGNNPYYCFDYIMEYNEGLLKKYPGSKYIQSLVISTLSWRIAKDLLFPYFQEKKEYDKSIIRIKNLIHQIDLDVIMNNPVIDVNKKMFFLKFSNRKFHLNKNGKVLCDDKEFVDLSDLFGEIYRLKIKDNELHLYGSYCCLLDNKNFEIILKKKYKNSEEVSKVKLVNTSLLHYNFNYDEKFLSIFDIKINLNDLKYFEFYLSLNKKEYKINFDFGKFATSDFTNNKYRIKFDSDNKRFKISKSNIFSRALSKLHNCYMAYLKNPKICVYRCLSHFLYNYKNIWIYTDNCNAVNNAYYQFIHDFDKKDNKKKYYIYSKGIDVNKVFSNEQKKYLVKYGSLKHKMLFLNSSKIITSFSDLQVYCPFNLSIKYYKDIARYELIYLQHGILHASLKFMYLKRVTEIDKFVISSNFEKNNLTNNYNYSFDNLLETGMPRMTDISHNDNVKKDTILFAPSWRSYLIGNIVNVQRELKTNDFVKSNYFKNIYNFLHSNELKKYLEDNNLKFVFKLHPNFLPYINLFNLDKLKYISIVDETDYNRYKLFITDFSSFQFDFIKLKIPTIYFLPDEKEFKSGLHTYRELDLQYEDAFGTLCKNDTELLKEMKRIQENHFSIDKKYLKRIESFFLNLKNPQDDIYNYLIESK